MPVKAWDTDITYIGPSQGWLYLSIVIDFYSRRILGCAMDKGIANELVISTLQRAIDRQPSQTGLLHHSDIGIHFCSKAHHALRDKYGIISSMNRKGNCYHNVYIESFHSGIKIGGFYMKNTVQGLRHKQVF